MARRGVFPGSFDPLTVAHVGIAEAAVRVHRLDVVELVVSTVPLGKSADRQRGVADRLAAIERAAAGRPWLAGAATDDQLLADIAAGYDVLVIGADKWHQLHDLSFYDDADHRRRCLDMLPTLAVAPRAGVTLPDDARDLLLAVPAHLAEVSSTAVRNGRSDWLAG